MAYFVRDDARGVENSFPSCTCSVSRLICSWATPGHTRDADLFSGTEWLYVLHKPSEASRAAYSQDKTLFVMYHIPSMPNWNKRARGDIPVAMNIQHPTSATRQSSLQRAMFLPRESHDNHSTGYSRIHSDDDIMNYVKLEEAMQSKPW